VVPIRNVRALYYIHVPQHVCYRQRAWHLLEKKMNDFLPEKAPQKKDLSDARYDMEGETLNSKY
jgi:hypothetical protein